MNLPEDLEESCHNLLAYLRSEQRIQEIEEDLLLTKKRNLVVLNITKRRFFLNKKTVKLDEESLRQEIEQLKKGRVLLDLKQQEEIIEQLVMLAKKEGNPTDIEKSRLIQLCYQCCDLLNEYDDVLSASYDTRSPDQMQAPSYMTGYFVYSPSVNVPYDMEKMQEISKKLLKKHDLLKELISKQAWSLDEDYKTIREERFEGFSNIKISSASFDYRVNREIITASKLRNAFEVFIPKFLDKYLQILRNSN